ncbi:hypothetical protein Taro_047928 [Colocasia esculenta]|uniref:Uncharacterized protein n=1 Tax=Colocasia esculenta TaxID=4460 RepID=A0A843X7J6_COLES|nr:hypothetical protein [Colocasia esculenta]
MFGWPTTLLRLTEWTLELRGKRGLDSGAESFVELSCLGLGRRGVWSSSWRRPDSPLSHCLTLRWFWNRVGRSGVGPQLGQAAVLRVFGVLWRFSITLPRRDESQLASRACGLRVPLLAASGGGLVAVVVTTLPHDISKVPAALAGEGLVNRTGPCSRGSPPYFLQLGARRRGSSVSDGFAEAAVASCVVSSSESECCELL